MPKQNARRNLQARKRRRQNVTRPAKLTRQLVSMLGGVAPTERVLFNLMKDGLLRDAFPKLPILMSRALVTGAWKKHGQR